MKDAIIELNRTLVTIINQSNLPMSAKYYIIKDVYYDAERAYYEYLNLLKEQNQATISDEQEHSITKEYEIDSQTGETKLIKQEET